MYSLYSTTKEASFVDTTKLHTIHVLIDVSCTIRNDCKSYACSTSLYDIISSSPILVNKNLILLVLLK